MGVKAEILDQQPRRDPRALEDDRQSAAGMGAPADEIHAVQILEPVVWPQVEHLSEGVGQVEGRSSENIVRTFSNRIRRSRSVIPIRCSRSIVMARNRVRSASQSMPSPMRWATGTSTYRVE
jgi:hypothetical protein